MTKRPAFPDSRVQQSGSSYRAFGNYVFQFLIASIFLYYWTPGGILNFLNVPKLLCVPLAAYAYVGLFQRISVGRGVPRGLFIILGLVISFQLFEFLSNFQSFRISPFELLVKSFGTLLWVTLPLLFIKTLRDVSATQNAYLITLVFVHAGIIANGLGFVSFDFGTNSEQKVLAGVTDISAFRSAGFMVNFGDVAIITAFVLPWLVERLWFSGTRFYMRPALAIILACAVSGAVISLSRNVWLSAVVALTVYFGSIVVQIPSRGTRILILLVLGTAFSGLAVLLATSAMDTVRAAQELRQESIDDRLSQYQAAFHEIRKNPLLGPGPGFTHNSVEIHNMYLNAFIHAGLGGAFVCLMLIYILVRLISKVLRREDQYRSILAGYTGILVSISFYPVILSSSPIFWLTFGVTSAAATLPKASRRVGQT